MDLVKNRSGMEKKFYELCLDIVGKEGLVLYELDYILGSTTLSLYIMNEETKTCDIDDCVKINKALAPYMEEDWVPEKLTLEVSSPGIYRKLSSKEHFESAVGQQVEVTFIKKLSDNNLPMKLKGQKTFVARFDSFEGEAIKIAIDDFTIDAQISDLRKVTMHPDINS